MLAALPVPHWLALVYTIAAPLPLFDLPDALARERGRASSSHADASRRAWIPGVVFVACVIVSRLSLDAGVTLGP